MQCVWVSPGPGEQDDWDGSVWMCWDPALEHSATEQIHVLSPDTTLG